jgi:hypothetical protein
MPGFIVTSSVAALLVGIAASLWTLSQDPPALRWNAAPAYEPIHIQLSNEGSSVDRLAHGLTFATVSNRESPNHVQDAEAMAGLHAHIKRSFPLVHSTLECEKVRLVRPAPPFWLRMAQTA